MAMKCENVSVQYLNQLFNEIGGDVDVSSRAAGSLFFLHQRQNFELSSVKLHTATQLVIISCPHRNQAAMGVFHM